MDEGRNHGFLGELSSDVHHCVGPVCLDETVQTALVACGLGFVCPFTIFMMFVQPVLIDPLYNDFYPLKDKALEEQILSLADRANIPAEHVFEVDMSEKTNSLNAYVTGVGSNSRIVLWDTTLEKLTDKEILFVMAHEMAHYVEKHIYIGIGDLSPPVLLRTIPDG